MGSNTAPFNRDNPSRLLVLACAVMERELLPFQNGRVDFRFLDYGLHLTPGNLTKVLQREIDQVPEGVYDGIGLGYGLCSNGVVGLRATNHPLVIPRVHDCISLFLGSSDRYEEEATKHPGTYYLTPGWIEKGETPMSKYDAYARSYDEHVAGWVLHEEMKHYTRILLIDTGIFPMSPYREIARQNAEFLRISFRISAAFARPGRSRSFKGKSSTKFWNLKPTRRISPPNLSADFFMSRSGRSSSGSGWETEGAQKKSSIVFWRLSYPSILRISNC